MIRVRNALFVAAAGLLLLGSAQAQTNVAPLGTAGNDGFNGVWGDPTNRINDDAWAWNSTHGFHSNGDQPTRIWVTWTSIYTIDRVDLVHCEAGPQYCSADYQIQSLNPGGNPTVDGDWTTVLSVTGNTSIFTSHSFAAVATEGIRLFVTDDGPQSPMRFEEMLIFGVPGVVGNTLTWDGVANDNWNVDARWSGTKPPNFPDSSSTVEIGPNAGNNTVTVAGVREANSVTITNNGQLVIGGGHSLNVVGGFSSGMPTILNAGATLSLSSGTLAGLQTAAGGGTATLVNTGSVDASHLIMAANDTFVSTGGALTFDLSGGSNSLDGTNTVQLNGGTLDMQAASNPLNGATLQLNGGTFTVDGAVGSQANALSHHGYHINNDNLALDLDNNGGLMGNGSPKSGPNYIGSALLTNGPGNRGLDFNGDAEFINLGVISRSDNYSNLFVGQITVTASTAGNWSFRRQADDDRMGIWLDSNNNGIFESSTPGLGSNRGEQLQWDNDNGTKTVALAAGNDYLFAVTHREGGGGSGVHVQVQAPTMGAFANIKPGDAAQAGMWSALVLDPLVATDSDVEVLDDSTLNVQTDTTAAFGTLYYKADDKSLITTGAPGGISFTATTFDVGIASAEIDTQTDTNLGAINDAGLASLTLTKRGLSDLTLAATPTSLATTTTLEVHQGTVNADYTGGATPSGSANFLLSGGTLAVTANGLDLQATVTVDVTGVDLGQLNQSVFFGVGQSYADVRGATYAHSLTRTMTGSKANTVLTAADSHSGLATAEIVNWNTFPAFNGSADSFLTAFSGFFVPTRTGNYGFRMANDDTEWMFFDLDHSGSFEAGEALGSQNNQNTNYLSLSAGVAYSFIAIAGENGGGQSINWYVTPPNSPEDRVNPADVVGNAGYWGTAGTATTLALTDTAASNLKNLVLKHRNLHVTGGSLLTVEQASISAATSGSVGVNADTTTILTNVSGFDGNNQTATVTAGGTGDLVLNKAGTNLGSATFLAEAGRLIGVSGGSNPFGTAGLHVDGGEIVLASDSGTARTYDNALEVLGDGTLTAGAGGQGGNNATITLGSASNVITLTSGILTVQTQDGYSLTIPGAITGTGGLNVTSAVTVERALSAGSLDLSAALTRSGAAAGDRAITVGDLYLRNAAGSLTIAAGETLTVNTSGLVEGGASLQLAGTMAGAGTVAVDTGSTLFGTSATVTAPVTIQSGGTIAAGAGTLGDTLDSLSTGNLTINDGGIYQWQLGATGDQIDVAGNLTLDNNWTLHLVDALAPLSLGDQLLFTYTGTANIGTVNFDTTGLPANWQTAGIELFHDVANKEVYIRNLVVTAASVGDLTWDGTNSVESEWSFGSGVDSHWDGGVPGDIPIFNLTATVDSGRVEVSAGDSAAHTLTVATGGNPAGEVEITSSRRLEITESAHINSGGLITVTDGTLFTNVAASVGAGGTLSVAANGALEVIQLNNDGTSIFAAGATGTIVQLNVDAGTTTLNTGGLTITGTTVTGGDLNLTTDVPMGTLEVTGGQVVAGANHAVLSTSMTLNSADYLISGGTFGAGGTINSTAAGRLNLTGGTLTIDPPGGTDIYSAGLEVWLDASTGITKDGSDTVTLWADQSGNGRDAVQTSGTGTWTADEINGLPAVVFNANNETLNLGGTPFFAYDTFLVFRANNGTGVFGPSWGAPFGVQNGDDNLRTWMLQPNEDRFWNGEPPGAVNWNGQTVSSANNFDMSGVAGGSAQMENYMVLKVTAGTANNIGAVRPYTVGTRMDGWTDARFATAEVLAYDHALDAAAENAVGYYLANKYGITTTYTAAATPTYSLPNPVLTIASTAVNLEAGTTLHVKASQAGFGGLTLENGVLTAEGPADGITFSSTTIAGASVGINTDTDVTSGAIDGGGLGATLAKSGTGELIVQGAGSNLTGATIDVQAGTLLGIGAPFDTATLQLSGGDTVLSSTGGNVTCNNAVTVTADSSLTLGAGTLGAAGPLDFTLGNAGTGIALNGGTLTLETTNDYQLIVPGTIAGAGNIDIVGTSVQASQGISGATVSIANTTLQTSGNITATGTLTLNGGTITSNGTLTISSTAGNVAVSATPNLTVAAGGHLTTFGGDSLGPLTYDFESGDLTGWSDVGTGFGPDNLFNNGNNPVSHGRMGGEQGSWYIDGYRTQANQNSDGHTGILESDSFILGPAASISFLIGGGSSAWSGDPDAPVQNLKGIGIEREVAPGDWENIHWESCGNCNTFQARNWNGAAYAGETLRVRAYDTHTGGWGWTAIDDLQISSVRDLTIYGALTLEAGSQLTLDDGTGPGNGTATFSSITASTSPAINGNVIVGGPVTIDSGSAETLTVTGNYTQDAGSTLQWEIDGAASDLINASGTIDGSADWNLEVNPLAPGLTINGTALMTGSAPPAAPGTVTITLTGLYSSLYTLSTPSVTVVGNSLVINGVNPVPPSTSQTNGDWNQVGTWDTGTVPTSLIAALIDGETVTVANPGAAASTVIISAGTLAVQQDLTLTATAQIGGTGTLTVAGPAGSVTGTEVTLASGGLLELNNGATVAAGSVNLGSGATLRSNGTQTLPANFRADSASTIEVASGTLSLDPTLVPSGLEAWFDASTGVTVDGSNTVTLWADQSGNGRDAVQNTGTGTLTANEINGRPAVIFNANNETLNVSGSQFFSYDTYMVFRSHTTNGLFGPSWGAPFGVQNGDDNLRTWMMQPNEDRFWNNEPPGAVNWNGRAIASANTFDMSSVVGGQGSNMNDYMVMKVTAGTANNLGVVRPYNIGTRMDQWTDSRFRTAEIMAFNRALNTAEENEVGGYLASKYGISTTYTGSMSGEFGILQVATGATLQNTGAAPVSADQLSGGGTIVSDTIVRTQLAPGSGGIGTVTVTGNAIVNSTATMVIDTVNTLSDTVAVSGSLTITDATLTIQGAASGTHIIATYGTLTGTFASINVPGAVIDYNYLGGNQIAITIPFIGTVIRIR